MEFNPALLFQNAEREEPSRDEMLRLVIQMLSQITERLPDVQVTPDGRKEMLVSPPVSPLAGP